jgi:hypothetical protein
MTETALNEMIAAFLTDDPADRRRSEKERVRNRRTARIRKNNKRMRILGDWGRNPHNGFVYRRYKGKTPQDPGVYLKYPRNSGGRPDLKRETNRAIRWGGQVPVKGNRYRRLTDFWWLLY